MSFIDKIRVNDEVYDIQDTDARKSIENLDNNKADKKDIPIDYATNNDIQDIETIIDIITPKAPPVKGELVHITDALNLPTFETKTSGNVKQETTTGKNKLNVPSTFAVTLYQDINVDLPSGAYTISATNITTNATSTSFLVQLMKVGGTTQNQYVYFNDKKASFTLDEAVEKIRIYAGGGYGDSVDKTTTFTNLMIRLTSITDDTYEPFTNGASPNPEFPQEVEVLERYNLANIKAIPNRTSPDLVVANDTITISNNTNTGGYTNTRIKLSDLCPDLKVGDLAKLSFKTTYTAYPTPYIYLEGFNKAWYSNVKTAQTITQEMLDSIVVLYGGYNTTTTISEFMITKGTNYKPYLPYGCVGYKVNGKNLFNDNVISGYRFGSDGNLYAEKGYNATEFINVKPNTTYATSWTIRQMECVCTYDKDKTFIRRIQSGTTFKISESEYYIRATVPDEHLPIAQIELGEVSTEIEPYQEQIVPLDLKGNWVGKINDNIKDYLVTDKKKYWLVKNVGKVVLDGSENWQQRTNSANKRQFYASTRILDKIKNAKQICNYAKEYNQSLFNWGLVNEFAILTNTKEFVINVSNTLELDTFKESLSINPLECYYVLAESQIIELGELPEPIKTFEGVNNIQLLANLDTNIEVKYALDVKKYYDNKLAEISAQII